MCNSSAVCDRKREVCRRYPDIDQQICIRKIDCFSLQTMNNNSNKTKKKNSDPNATIYFNFFFKIVYLEKLGPKCYDIFKVLFLQNLYIKNMIINTCNVKYINKSSSSFYMVIFQFCFKVTVICL